MGDKDKDKDKDKMEEEQKHELAPMKSPAGSFASPLIPARLPCNGWSLFDAATFFFYSFFFVFFFFVSF